MIEIVPQIKKAESLPIDKRELMKVNIRKNKERKKERRKNRENK